MEWNKELCERGCNRAWIRDLWGYVEVGSYLEVCYLRTRDSGTKGQQDPFTVQVSPRGLREVQEASGSMLSG